MPAKLSVVHSSPVCLGVALSVQSVLFLWAAIVEGHHPPPPPATTPAANTTNDTTTTTPTAPLNNNISTTTTNFTGPWPEHRDEDESIFTSKGFINGMIGLGCVVIGLGIAVAKHYYYRSRHPRQQTNLAAPPPPYENGVSQPVPQTWNLQSMAGSSATSGSAPTSVQPSSFFATTASSNGMSYSNNNLGSNYSTAADYSSVVRL